MKPEMIENNYYFLSSLLSLLKLYDKSNKIKMNSAHNLIC